MAPHTWLGFSTATWEGEKLRITTTHLKENWYRRNGPPQSDEATLTEYVMRRQFQGRDYLTWVIIAHDDTYLSEPLIRSTEYQDALNQQMTVYPCTPVTEVIWPDGYVPHILPGQNDRFTDFAVAYGLPMDIMYDGAQTMYPEYQAEARRLRQVHVADHGSEFRRIRQNAEVTMVWRAAFGRHRRLRCGLVVAVAACGVAASLASRQAGAQQMPPRLLNPPDAEVYVLPVRENVFMISGAGGNITASVGVDGVLLVDSGLAQMSDRVIAAIERIQDAMHIQGRLMMEPVKLGGSETESRMPYHPSMSLDLPLRPLRHIVNTHAHADHVGGNAVLGVPGYDLYQRQRGGLHRRCGGRGEGDGPRKRAYADVARRAIVRESADADVLHR